MSIEKSLSIPPILPDMGENPSGSEYFVVPLTPNSEHPHTNIHLVNIRETTELIQNPVTPEASTTIHLPDPEPCDSYTPDETLPTPYSTKRAYYDSSEENDNRRKKRKKSPPPDLRIPNLSQSKRPISISSPQPHTPSSSTGEQLHERTPTSPKQRGRPVKSTKNGYLAVARTPTDEFGAGKRGRGRPPKYTSMNSIGESGKHKRGRPPLPAKKPRSLTSSSSTSQQYEYGNMIWGKIKSCEWWPGMVIAPSVIGKNETPQGCLWVTWFGEYQYSDVLHKNIKPITSFLQLLSPLSFSNPTYKNAIFKCIQIAKKRTELYKRTKISSEDDFKEEQDSAPVNFEELLNDRNSKEKQREIRSLSNLTQDEQSKLTWALERFQPYGLSGLLSRCEDELSPIAPCYQMIDSGSEIDSIEDLSALESVRGRDERFSFSNSSGQIAQEFRAEKERRNNQGNLDLLKEGKIEIENFCLGCHKHEQNLKEHPLIEGGFCELCFREFQACFYLFDENGEQEYCSICAGGENVVICNNSSCASFCQGCIQDLISKEEKEAIINSTDWHCFLCQQAENEGPLTLNHLKVRPDWNDKLLQIFRNTNIDHPYKYRATDIPAPRPAKHRTPLRVLALFDGISTSLLALKELGFEIDYYIASEIDISAQRISQTNHTKVTQIGDVKKIGLEDIEKWGPFDLVCAGPPSQDLSNENPNRKGLYDQRGTGPLMFEFYRILNYCFPKEGDIRPFFWFFEYSCSMRSEDKDTISRFLAQDPITILLKQFSALDEQSYFWSNIPGLNRPKVPGHNAKLHLQDCLMNGLDRFAKTDKIKPPSYRISRSRETVYPVRVRMPDSDLEDDNLFVNELEQVHSLPRHYTDVCNTSIEDRQSLIENSWCVPVIKYVLAPLKGYFKSTPSPVD